MNQAEQDPSQIPLFAQDILRNPPENIEDPRVKVRTFIHEQSGLIPLMAEKNPELPKIIADFLIGDKSILLVVGESGMGKSLLAADLRSLHRDYTTTFGSGDVGELAVISWDRTHKVFYEEASVAAGGTIDPPEGETLLRGRELVSFVLEDQIRFIKKYVGGDTRILVETPLIDSRGNSLIGNLGGLNSHVQTLVMHSPSSRDETLKEGRMISTSGQKASMDSIRENLIRKILGHDPRGFSQEACDNLIKAWWASQLLELNGIIVEWDPDDNRNAFEDSREKYRQTYFKPDVLSPIPLSYFTRGQYESIFRTIKDLDSFLKALSP